MGFGRVGFDMIQVPYDSGYLKAVRHSLGEMIPQAKATQIADAMAAGFGFRTAAHLSEDVRKAAATPIPGRRAFDVDRCTAKLKSFGITLPEEASGRIESEIASGGQTASARPRGGTRDRGRQQLLAAERAMQTGNWEEAASLLADVMQLGSPSDKPAAVRAMERLADVLPGVRVNLALALLSGDGVAPDRKRAVAMLKKLAATAGMSRDTLGTAHNWLAHASRGAFGGPADNVKAVSHFEQAASYGNPEAAFNAGLAHQNGMAGSADIEKACSFYSLAAKLGDPRAMTNLAVLIASRDQKRALGLLEKAAQLSDLNAKESLARLELHRNGGTGSPAAEAPASAQAALEEDEEDDDPDYEPDQPETMGWLRTAGGRPRVRMGSDFPEYDQIIRLDIIADWRSHLLGLCEATKTASPAGAAPEGELKLGVLQYDGEDGRIEWSDLFKELQPGVRYFLCRKWAEEFASMKAAIVRTMDPAVVAFRAMVTGPED